MEGEAAVGQQRQSDPALRVKGAGVSYPEGTPWWAKLAIQFVSVIGIPAAICGFLLWERGTVLRDFSKTIDSMNKVVERMAPVLERLERKVGP
jgi:hypothetical protein